MDSSSEDEARNKGYAPVLAERMAKVFKSPSMSKKEDPAGKWFMEGVSLYNNDLFTGGDVLGGNGAGRAAPSASAGTGSDLTSSTQGMSTPKAPRMQSAAAQRLKRLQESSSYEPNQLLKNSPSIQQRNMGGMGSESMMRSGSGIGQRSGGSSQPSMSLNARGESASGAGGRVPGIYDPNAEDPYHPQHGPGPQYPQQHLDPGQQQQQQQQHANYAPVQGLPQGGYLHNTDSSNGMAPPRGGAMAPTRESPPQNLDLSDMVSFLMQPAPMNGPIHCRIQRQKTGSASSKNPKYLLFLEHEMRFLLSAQKRKNQTTSNYVISLDMEDTSRDGDNFFGKVRANFVGTEFTLFDSGDKPGEKKSRSSRGQPRQELASVLYQYNVLGSRGPRKMTACIPAIDASGRTLYRMQSEEDTLVDRVKSNRGLEEVVLMRNKPPKWNDELEAYCLNFNGRVTEASVKNFQLVTDDNHGHVILQFGKVGPDTFTMDYQWPITALQAFALCITSFDNKLGCE